MSKRSVFTTVTGMFPVALMRRMSSDRGLLVALDAGITRETVLQTLHDHIEMIDLNPLVIERHPIKPPSTASPEEFHCQWYQLTDQVQYLPGGLVQGKVSYNVCFHDLSRGLQTHCLAPVSYPFPIIFAPIGCNSRDLRHVSATPALKKYFALLVFVHKNQC